ncbi:methionine aminopeptidase, type I [Oceanithermus profundus DSM 14977]|uniref:Methionine aminopeptidase n=1 Tax=Oceanithermus profundus (strain DSM 14977 / NBRC 100410 / VKM B-2274 / 506) TaxID=670487 RepID=E4U9G3_OCEP5|nr:type I methionyl aminopeptidase [Oceanithermus profundus]ADR37059.1 methionine aminopeptidase, type I [Oceanithermus profundus DSM 14977]
MPIVLKSPAEIERMAEAGARLTEVMDRIAEAVRPGVSTLELDRIAREGIEAQGAKPAFLGLYGFPATICASPNEVVVHGIPSERPLEEGEILSVDVGLFYGGYAADMARTFPVGAVSEEAARLIRVTEESFWKGFEAARPGARLGDVSAAIQQHVEDAGFWVVREFVGHGIGSEMHEDPQLPNFGRPGVGPKLRPGMTLAIEPMVTLHAAPVVVLEDGWTASSGRGNLAAHYENTVAVTESGPRLLTGRR